MAEDTGKLTFKNPYGVCGHSGEEFWLYEFAKSPGNNYDSADWDIEVTLTRKCEPFKAGDVVYLEDRRYSVYKIFHITGEYAWVQDTAEDFPPATVLVNCLSRVPGKTR